MTRDMYGEGDLGIVEFTPDDKSFEKGEACRFQVAVLRDQTPTTMREKQS